MPGKIKWSLYTTYMYVYIYIPFKLSVSLYWFQRVIVVVDLNIKAAKLGIRNMPMFNHRRNPYIYIYIHILCMYINVYTQWIHYNQEKQHCVSQQLWPPGTLWRLVCARQSPSSCFITSADQRSKNDAQTWTIDVLRLVARSPIHQSKRIQAIIVIICDYIVQYMFNGLTTQCFKVKQPMSFGV